MARVLGNKTRVVVKKVPKTGRWQYVTTIPRLIAERVLFVKKGDVIEWSFYGNQVVIKQVKDRDVVEEVIQKLNGGGKNGK